MKLPNVKPNNPQLAWSRYSETPSPSCKLKSASLNVNAKTFRKKNTITSERKSSPFSEDMDSHALMLKEIKHLETRLEKQISKTNVLEKELEELKQENLSLKTKLKACIHYFLLNFYFLPNDSPSKTMKSVFYFI